MSDHILLEVARVLPDLTCDKCGEGLDVYSDDDDFWYDTKTGICPKCGEALSIDKSVTTTYTIVRPASNA